MTNKLPQLTTKGKFFWKKRWYSICSAHVEYDENCPRCKVGAWHNMWGIAIDSFFCRYFYKIWFYRHNGCFPNKK